MQGVDSGLYKYMMNMVAKCFIYVHKLKTWMLVKQSVDYRSTHQSSPLMQEQIINFA